MNQKQAMHLLTVMLTGLQKYRSNAAEEFNTEENDVARLALKDVWPWAFGEKGDYLLKALAMVVDRGRVAPIEFYNFMFALECFIPEVKSFIEIYYSFYMQEKIEFPMPTPQLASQIIEEE